MVGIRKVGLPFPGPEKKAGKNGFASRAVSFLRSGLPGSYAKFRRISLVSATVLENFSTVQTVWRRRVNANLQYNFAFLFKRRVFIYLGVLILDRQLPENLVQATCPHKVVRFPRLFLAKERDCDRLQRRGAAKTSVQEPVDFRQRLTARITFRQCELFL